MGMGREQALPRAGQAESKGKPGITPQKIAEDFWGGWKTQTIIAGIQLDVFTYIAAGQRTAKAIARAARASQRGTERLLDALVGLGYLKKRDTEYALDPIAEKFLVRGKETYLGGMAYTTMLRWDTWPRLAQAVRTGLPVRSVRVGKARKRYFSRLVRVLFPGSFSAAQFAVAALPLKTRQKIRTILDVAAGSGAWSIAFAKAMPDARVTVVDFPEIIPVTRRFTRRMSVAERYEYMEGNLRQADFGRNRFDLVILGHIIHSEGARWGKRLIKKSYRALRRGGQLLIAEWIPNDRRTGPALPLLFGLNMLLHSEEGNVFTLREYRQWLKDAGFRKVTIIPTQSHSPLILAGK
jgi:ubiquinone/menaquinone biosynthesis C-methylase UbiE